jgi:hypothetical protein
MDNNGLDNEREDCKVWEALEGDDGQPCSWGALMKMMGRVAGYEQCPSKETFGALPTGMVEA